VSWNEKNVAFNHGNQYYVMNFVMFSAK
jgi:hypothetical protein